MEITWLGHGCVRLKNRDTTIIVDPFNAATGYSTRFGEADVVTISHDHEAHNNAEAVPGKRLVIKGPGEYEVAGVLITGVRTFHDARRGADRGSNTAFVFEMDEVRVCHLGDIGHIPTPDQVSAMNGADVLLLPVGGHTTIDGAAAAEVISLLEPRLAVPLHYRTEVSKDDLDSLEMFLRQMGVSAPQPVGKLTVAKTSLPLEMTLAVLDYRHS